jgi:hypothetical protein
MTVAELESKRIVPSFKHGLELTAEQSIEASRIVKILLHLIPATTDSLSETPSFTEPFNRERC